MTQIRVGISGWRYPPWRGVFYPKKLPQRLELAYASRQLNSIEINGTFYSLQRPESYLSWYEAVPDDFVFSIKGGRFITHIKRLKEVDEPVARFFGSGVLLLKQKLGPFLWQFPPNMKWDPKKFKTFFKLLPRDTRTAQNRARKLGVLAHPPIKKNFPVRHAIEVRNESFNNPEFIALLRKENIALVVADTAGKWPYFEELTSDFVYARLHGDSEIYVSGYTDKALKAWARKFRKWSGKMRKAKDRQGRDGRDLFVYFDNDSKVKSPHDAGFLLHELTDFQPTALTEDRGTRQIFRL